VGQNQRFDPSNRKNRERKIMSEHRQWDENRSPQWKYLFQKEAQSKRKTRKDLDKELRDKQQEENEEYSRLTKFGVNPSGNRIRKKSRKNNTRKVSKEELKAKLEKEINSYHKG
jgi:hypothetical protein